MRFFIKQMLSIFPNCKSIRLKNNQANQNVRKIKRRSNKNSDGSLSSRRTDGGKKVTSAALYGTSTTSLASCTYPTYYYDPLVNSTLQTTIDYLITHKANYDPLDEMLTFTLVTKLFIA